MRAVKAGQLSSRAVDDSDAFRVFFSKLISSIICFSKASRSQLPPVTSIRDTLTIAVVSLSVMERAVLSGCRRTRAAAFGGQSPGGELVSSPGSGGC